MEAIVLAAVAVAFVLVVWGVSELMTAAILGNVWAKVALGVLAALFVWVLLMVFGAERRAHDPRPCLRTTTIFIYNPAVKTSLPHTSCAEYGQPEGNSK